MNDELLVLECTRVMKQYINTADKIERAKLKVKIDELKKQIKSLQ